MATTLHEPTALGTITVLVIDDHRMFTDSLVRLLSEEPDLDVRAVAGTLAEGRAEAARHEPDVIVLDYRLPDVSGAAAIAELRVASPESRVLVVTGVAEDSVVGAVIDAGGVGFVTKDRAADELVAAIRAAHRGEMPISAGAIGALLPLRRSATRTGPQLTSREVEVLALMAQGLGSRALAERLVISRNTVRNHIQSVLNKLGAHSQLEAVAIARRNGLLDAVPPAG